MKVLITGITGFCGSHLAEHYLQATDHDVYGLVRRRSPLSNIRDILDKVKLIDGDLTDSHGMEAVIKEVKPDFIHHLAGQSFVPISWKTPTETFHTNVMGSLNLFEAVKREYPECVIHVASSSETYGRQLKTPLTESMLPNPASPYGVSKLTMEYLAKVYVESHGSKIVITRAFNHTGPRRGQQFVTSKIAKEFAKRKDLEVGNIHAIRDWTDVRDIVKAYRLAVLELPYGKPFNICSGEGHSIDEIIKILIEVTSFNPNICINQAFIRPNDIDVLLGDPTKFMKQTHWCPEIDFKETITDLYNYWVNQ